MNLDFAFLNWGVMQSFVLEGLVFSFRLKLVAVVGASSWARCWRRCGCRASPGW